MNPSGRDERLIVLRATREAENYGNSYVDTEHLLLSLIGDRDSAAVRVLESLGIGVGVVRLQVEQAIRPGHREPGRRVSLAPRAQAVLELARQEAAQAESRVVDSVHVLLGLIREGEGVAASVLAKQGADLAQMRRAVLDGPQVWSAVRASLLDLTEAARNDDLGLVIGRDREVGRLIRVLSQYFAGSPVLVYEAGADQLSVVARLAQRIAAGDVPAPMQGKRLGTVNLVALAEALPVPVAPGEQLTKMVVSELARLADLLFCADDLRLLSAGNASAPVIFEALLADGRMKIIGVMVQAGSNESPEMTILEKFELIRVSEPITSYDIGLLKQALRDI